jgi:hypothetical protein
MPRQQCPDCKGTDLFYGRMEAANGVIISRMTTTGPQWAGVRCAICMTCGFVAPYVDDEGLSLIKNWSKGHLAETAPAEPPPVSAAQTGETAPGSSDSPARPDGGPGPGFGTVMLIFAAIGAALGLATVIYGLMQR